ncbi:glycoside hydrolase [Meira miltonrushii]|uniref:mannan endo-1,4-beta-mannosidase n=1 Tax=Meira miltonrushii TaxID=1280837 RepID=A0A316VHT5_9BASI|nr:glycoside hydrolase [Meira miltonrushii]PWN36598.1 glycoside hydrolase [Meira miltonrushii]
MSQFETTQIQQDDFIRVSELGFKDSHDKPFFIQGINYWSCMNLAAEAEMGGNLTRLQVELDRLKEVGVNVIRIMAATEGASAKQPFRVYPVMQPSPGQWDERMFVALDRCIAEAGKRNIRVLMVMGNTWQWTGGIAQYVSWANDDLQIPYPRSWDMKAAPQRDDGYAGWGNWTDAEAPSQGGDDFMSFQARFYEDTKAQELYENHLLKVLNRTNSITGRAYVHDPTILAWEPLNEPQTADAAGKKIAGTSEDDPMIAWHHKVSSLIKSKAPHQLSTTGSEAKQSEALFKSLHAHHSIDFCCAHIWAEIWGYYDMLDGSSNSLQKAKHFASKYLDKVRSWSNDISKPIILEEFGMARDNWKNKDSAYTYSTKASTTHRDAYFSHLFEIVFSSFQQRTGFAGLMPWSYGGLFDTETQQYNSFDMVLAGDPPQEPPGWFSVLYNDSTMGLMSKWHEQVVSLFVC